MLGNLVNNDNATGKGKRKGKGKGRSAASSILRAFPRNQQPAASSSTESNEPNFMSNTFTPWWPEPEAESASDTDPKVSGHYASRVQLCDGEIGILPDTGAHDGLCGSKFARAQADACKQYGKSATQRKLEVPRTAQGVGHGVQSTDYMISLTAGLEDVHGNRYEETYEAPCLDNSSCPGLMGIQSLKRNDALIRCSTGEMWFLGKGGVEINASPGSKHFQMKLAPSGHWLLPINKFQKGDQVRSAGLTLTTETANDESVTPDAAE